jgi:hypothetical protein
MKTFTITLTDEQVAVLAELKQTRGNRTDEQLLAQVVERGLYQLQYRTERNKKVYAEQAAIREEVKQLRAAIKDMR